VKILLRKIPLYLNFDEEEQLKQALLSLLHNYPFVVSVNGELLPFLSHFPFFLYYFYMLVSCLDSYLPNLTVLLKYCNIFQLMVIGEIGEIGDLVQSLVRVERNLKQDRAVTRHLLMVALPVVDQQLQLQVVHSALAIN
jgi:hypothetical protein